MAIQITHVRFDSNNRLANEIIAYQWTQLEDQKTGTSDKPTLVDWVARGNAAYVGSGSSRIAVAVVSPRDGDPYLRTHADGEWTNNLENLDTF